MIRRPDAALELDGLIVEPTHPKQGIGARPIKRCIRAARAAAANAVHVIGNPHAGRFYLKCGFVPTGEIQTEFGPATRFIRAV